MQNLPFGVSGSPADEAVPDSTKKSGILSEEPSSAAISDTSLHLLPADTASGFPAEEPASAPIPESLSRIMEKLRSSSVSNPDGFGSLPEELVLKALLVVNNMALWNKADETLYASALKLLSYYASLSEENKNLVSSVVKNHVGGLASHFVKSHLDGTQVALVPKDGQNQIQFVIEGIPFTFSGSGLSKRQKTAIEKAGGIPVTVSGEPDSPELIASLFHYLWNHRQFTSDQTTDGRDLDKTIDPLLQEYRDNQFTLEDAKVPLTEYETVAGEDPDAAFPFRSLPAVTLYENRMGTFLSKICNRTLVSEITEVYEKGFGFPFSDKRKYQLKYILESLLRILQRDSVNPDVGVRLDYVRTHDSDCYMLCLLSEDDEHTMYTAVISLLPWLSVTIPPEGGMVEYTSEHGTPGQTCVHPAILTDAYLRYKAHNMALSENVCFQTCSYLFDAGPECVFAGYLSCTPSCLNQLQTIYATEWNSLYLEENRPHFLAGQCRCAPIYSAAETEELFRFIRSTVSHGLSEDSFNLAVRLNEISEQNTTDRLPISLRLVVESIQEAMINQDKILIVVDCQGKSEQDSLISALRMNLPPLTGIRIIRKPAPGLLQEDAPNRTVLVTSLSALSDDDWEKYLKMKLIGEQYAYITQYFPISRDSTFSDNGDGNYLLRTLFNIIEGLPVLWNSSLYHISLVDCPEDFTEEKDGIANIIVSGAVNLNAETQEVCLSHESARDLQKELLRGIKGVTLHIEDLPLREKMKRILDIYNQSLSVLAPFLPGDSSWKEPEELLENSITRNRLESLVKDILGESYWNLLSEESRKWVTTALLTYEETLENAPEMDYTGVVLMLSKIFEQELGERMVVPYLEYLKDKYGDDYSKYPKCCLFQKGEDAELEPFDPKYVSLGSIPFLIGRDIVGKVIDEAGHDEFLEFAKTRILKDPDHAEDVLKSLCSVANHVRLRFRNKAAHKNPVSAEEAKECIEYALTKDKKLLSILEPFLK